MYCGGRRAFIPSAIYNARRTREQPIPNINAPSPTKNLSDGSDASVESENESIENMPSDDNHSFEFVKFPTKVSIASNSSLLNDIASAELSSIAADSRLDESIVTDESNLQATTGNIYESDGESDGESDVESDREGPDSQAVFSPTGGLDETNEPSIKVEPIAFRMNISDEHFLSVLTEDEEGQETEENGSTGTGPLPNIKDDTDRPIFVDDNGVEVKSVPEPIQCTEDFLVKKENDEISGNLPFRESVCIKYYFLFSNKWIFTYKCNSINRRTEADSIKLVRTLSRYRNRYLNESINGECFHILTIKL